MKAWLGWVYLWACCRLPIVILLCNLFHSFWSVIILVIIFWGISEIGKGVLSYTCIEMGRNPAYRFITLLKCVLEILPIGSLFGSNVFCFYLLETMLIGY